METKDEAPILHDDSTLRASLHKNIQFFVTNPKMNFLPAVPMPILNQAIAGGELIVKSKSNVTFPVIL